MTSKRISLCFCLIGLLAVGGYAQAFKAEKLSLPESVLSNFYEIDKGVYRSEQPSPTDFMALQKFGIREVLNLRRWHSDDDEAKGTTLTLHRVKTNAHDISEEELTAALRIIKQRKGPILIHCRHGSDRTGAVCALYRIVFQGVSKEDAIHEMVNGGFGFHGIYKNIIRTIRQMDVARVRQTLQ